MSEYNPFDMAPSPPSDEKPKPQAAIQPPAQESSSSTQEPGASTDQAYAPSIGIGGDVRYASPSTPAQRPTSVAPPGRAPLAGQAASGGPVMPAAPSSYGSRPAASAPPPPQPAAPPTPQPGVQYDLGGNPLPQSAPSPQGAPPQEPQYASAVRYDLAGNPLPPQFPSQPAAPPPPAPGAPYGYSPAPTPHYGGGGYQSAPPAYSAPPPIVPAGMEEAMTNGANWMIGIVLLTLASIWLNKLTYPIMMPYISYAAISGVIDMALLMGHALGGYTTAAVLASIGLLPLALLAVLGFKRQAWVFMIAMIVYGIDIPITIVTWLVNFSIWGIILGTAWHSFVFQRMFAAFTAAREINATLAGRRI